MPNAAGLRHRSPLDLHCALHLIALPEMMLGSGMGGFEQVGCRGAGETAHEFFSR